MSAKDLRIAALAVWLLLCNASVVEAGPTYTWMGVYQTGNDTICGSKPSGCLNRAADWIKATYPPQSIMFNVVWNFEVVNNGTESGPPTADGQYGGFTLSYYYTADYIGTCCGYQGQTLHYRSPQTGGQQWWFWTVASVRASYYVAPTPIAKLFAENGSSCPKGGAVPSMSHCGDPINPASGNTYQSAQDVSANDLSPMAFTRYYNSTGSTQTGLGTGWRGSFSRSVKANASIASFLPLLNAGSTHSSLYNDEASACTSGFAQVQSQVATWSGAVASFSNGVCSLSKGGIYIGALPIYSAYDDIVPESFISSVDYTSDSGQVTRFSIINGVITAPPGYGLKLTQTASGFTLTDGNDNVEQYDTTGKLLSIDTRTGIIQAMSYDGSGRLSVVSDNFGHQLTLGYDAQNRLISVTRQ